MKPSKRSLPDQIKANAKTPIEHKKKDTVPFFPTGSSVLNLACSDEIDLGYAKGTMINVIGDSDAGKTMLVLTQLARTANMERFNKYALINDVVERKNAYNIPNLFGEIAAKRIVPPGKDKHGDPVYSQTVQDFRNNIFRLFDKGKPFIYVLDSFDSLTSEEELKKIKEHVKASEEGKETKGTYGMDKAKGASQLFRTVVKELDNMNSLLVVVSQTRDNISPMSFVEKTRNGGKALDFYATHIMWLAKLKHIVKTIRDQKVIIGVNSKIKLSKNHLNGKYHVVETPIYSTYGIDDIGAMVDFMVKWKFWSKSGAKINATNLKEILTRDKLIHHIESTGTDRLERAVQRAWIEVEDALQLNRKRKFK